MNTTQPGFDKENLSRYLDTLKSNIGKITSSVLLMLLLLLGNSETAQGQIVGRSRAEIKKIIVDTYITQNGQVNNTTLQAHFDEIRSKLSQNTNDLKVVDRLLSDNFIKGDAGSKTVGRVILFYYIDKEAKYDDIGGFAKRKIDKDPNDDLTYKDVQEVIDGAKLVAAISKLKE